MQEAKDTGVSTVYTIPGSGDEKEDDTWRKINQINQYFSTFTENGVITKVNFMQAIGDKNKSFLAERFFDSLDDDKSMTLDIGELNRGAQRLLSGDPKDRVAFIFSLYDFDGDGSISFDELLGVLKSSSTESSMYINDDNLATLTDTFMNELDEDGDGMIDLTEMGKYLEKNPKLIMGIANESISWLLPPDTPKKVTKKRKVPVAVQIKNNATLYAFFCAMALINAALFIVNCHQYRDSNWWIIIARGAGMCLDFNVSFIILLPLKRFITFLRMSELRKWLPIDHNIYLHMLFACLIIFFSVIHTVAHIGNAATVAEDDYNVTMGEFIFTTEADIGWVAGLAPITGVVLVVTLTVMAILSLPFIRRSGHFEVFFWSHKLYYVFYIMCIFHATHFWKWFLIPALIFGIELITFYWFKKGLVQEVAILPSGVTQLVIKPDQEFKFHAGDYVYICLPAISKKEWHPFTISSSPQVTDSFGLHIRAAGSWTNRLKDYFVKKGSIQNHESFRYLKDNNNGVTCQETNKDDDETSVTITSSSIRRSMRKRAMTKIVHDEILITGPFGTPCREIFQTKHVILIGAGIGVTPFASILQTIFLHTKRAAVSCPKCQHRWFNWDRSGKPIVDKIDFVWINRGSKSFEWFVELLFELQQEFAILDMEDVFKMHLYMTGAHKMQELRGMGIQVALDLNYEKTKTDCLTGLSTKTKAGRPNFDELFTEISNRSPFEKKVFMCGSPMLAKDVKYHCEKFGFGFSKEHF